VNAQRKRLAALADVTGPARRPGYDPADHGCGIVHLGTGAFHRAHQAVYTDDALREAGGDWRIVGVSLRNPAIADAMNPQNGLYTLIERGAAGVSARVAASVDHVIAATRNREAPLAALARPQTRVVTLTVTEKAYGIDRKAMAIDPAHPAIAADLASPRTPAGAIGLIVESLRRRRENNTAPYTVLCCDNLPENGELLRAGVVDFASRTDPDLASWIREKVSFPSSMVDRITPASTEATYKEAAGLTGCVDLAAVETEPFSQWVIEDRFTAGRPAWEKGGAVFVDDVRPYEMMKLRMLNGAHSMLAYTGFLSARAYVRDVMSDDDLSLLVNRHIHAAQQTLPPVSGFDLDQYRRDLVTRFENPAIAHETYQIAMDGTEKLPQRILAPAMDTLRAHGDLRPFAFTVAAWMRYCLGRNDDDACYALRDPREHEIPDAIAGLSTARDIAGALHGLSGLFDPVLVENEAWRSLVADSLQTMLECGVRIAVAREAESVRSV